MLYVFSTALANQASDAVKCGRVPNIITFHQSLDDTKRFLNKNSTASSKCSPSKLAINRSLSTFSNTPNPLGECASVSSPRTSTNSEPSNETPPSKFSFKSELPQPCSKSVDEKRLSTNETLISSSSSVGGRPNSRDNGFSPSADAGNLPLTDVPFTNSGGDPLEKMARLTQETLPFEPPLKQQKLGSPREKPKIPDDQLTPAARQHRHEALQKIEGLKQVFGLSQVQQPSLYMPGQPSMIGLHPQDAMKMEQSSCPSSINEAQLNWQRVREEHEMKKMQTSAMNKVGPMADPGVPTMMVQGKPAVMVHPVSAPRPMNSRTARSAGPRLMAPLSHNPEAFLQNGPNFDPSFCPSYDFVAQQQPRCFVLQQPARMPPGMAGPPGQAMFGPRPMVPGGPSMNLNMNIHVNPPEAVLPQPCYQEFVGSAEEEEAFYDGGMYPPGVSMGMCGGNMQPVGSSTYFCGPNGMLIDDGNGGPPRGNVMGPNFSMETYPNKGVQMTSGPQPMVNNTFVNATMSIQQVNIQNVSPFPTGNIVRVQSMQPSQSVPSLPYMVARPNGPPQPPPSQHQQFVRRPSSYSPMQTPTQNLRNFGPAESTRFLLQDFAEPLRNLDSKVPSQKLQYFPNASQPRPFDANGGGGAPPPQPPPGHLVHQTTPASADTREILAPNAIVSFDGRQNDVSYQNFQQQLYSMNPRRSDSMSN